MTTKKLKQTTEDASCHGLFTKYEVGVLEERYRAGESCFHAQQGRGLKTASPKYFMINEHRVFDE